MKHIAIFASGTGTNAKAVIEHFRNHPSIRVSLIVTNNPAAGVIKIAHDNKIISAIVTKEALVDEELMTKLLGALNIEFIILAGFLQLLPAFLLQRFPKKIINIHPALLPKFGGKGMFGMKVFEEVLAAKEAETGITIHYVNERYDEGEVIVQQKIKITTGDTAETLSKRIQALEHQWLPKTVEIILGESKQITNQP
jgi:phosphoribosylglycinamide formyltransferase-1